MWILNAETALWAGVTSVFGSGAAVIASAEQLVPHDTITVSLPVFILSVLAVAGAMFRLGHYKATQDFVDAQTRKELDEYRKRLIEIEEENRRLRMERRLAARAQTPES